MNRALVIAVLLVVLGGAYIFFARLEKATSTPETPEASSTAVQIMTATEQEETETYILNAKYPRLGIPEINLQIKTIMDDSIEAFKQDATGPLVTSAKYEFI